MFLLDVFEQFRAYRDHAVVEQPGEMINRLVIEAKRSRRRRCQILRFVDIRRRPFAKRASCGCASRGHDSAGSGLAALRFLVIA